MVLVRGCDACRAVGGGLQSGDRPHRRQPRRRVSPAPFFLADCGGLSVGCDPVGRDLLGVRERSVGGVLFAPEPNPLDLESIRLGHLRTRACMWSSKYCRGSGASGISTALPAKLEQECLVCILDVRLNHAISSSDSSCWKKDSPLVEHTEASARPSTAAQSLQPARSVNLVAQEDPLLLSPTENTQRLPARIPALDTDCHLQPNDRRDLHCSQEDAGWRHHDVVVSERIDDHGHRGPLSDHRQR